MCTEIGHEMSKNWSGLTWTEMSRVRNILYYCADIFAKPHTNADLLSGAFACSKALHAKGVHTWFTSICSILRLLGIPIVNDKRSNLNLKSVKKYTKSTILDKYKDVVGAFSHK